MATIASEFNVPTKPGHRSDEYEVVTSDRSLGRNLPQRVASKLWGPMFVMAVMAFPAAVILAIIRASLVAGADPADTQTIAALQHVTVGVMFIGFASVFSAITFAIARILGAFRSGGGSVQETAHVEVETLKMPITAKGMILGMMMAMMLILVPVVLHFVAAASVVGPTEAELLRSEQWFDVLEGVRRFGVVTYLASIMLGLMTIIHVLRFQSLRIKETADEAGSHQ